MVRVLSFVGDVGWSSEEGAAGGGAPPLALIEARLVAGAVAGGAVAVAGRIRAAALGVALCDLGSAGRDCVPLRAERVDLLAVRLALTQVVGERVKRVVVVGDLQVSVGASRRSEQRRLCSRRRPCLA